ncbi:MAG: D-amino-acid dehydrogenase [Granulosicoccus sp.]|jgi:D-amino-acid dehydrogenase
MSSNTKHVMIIGGGVIGLCSAYYLRKSGCEVTVVDRSAEDDSSGCSYGNAGFIVPSHFIPLAAPGMMSQGLKWMLKSDSPFYVKPRLDLDLIKWTLHFQRAATKARVDMVAPVLRDISLRSKTLFHEMSKDFQFQMKDSGLRMMYKTEACRAEELELAEQAAKLGIEAKELTSTQVQSMESSLETNVIGAITYPGDSSLNPSEFMHSLWQSLIGSGVKFIYNTEVLQLKMDAGSISSLMTNSGELKADEFVLAGGTWSQNLAKQIGLNLPLQAGKGYNVTVQNPAQQVSMPSILCEAKVTVSPFESALRFGGTMELSGLDKSISQVRLNAIKKAVINYFPNYDSTVLDVPKPWAGLRPCSPDGLPYIGKTCKADNLIIAAGHAMLGLSLGPVTGEFVANTVVHRLQDHKVPCQLDPDRFL